MGTSATVARTKRFVPFSESCGLDLAASTTSLGLASFTATTTAVVAFFHRPMALLLTAGAPFWPFLDPAKAAAMLLKLMLLGVVLAAGG